MPQETSRNPPDLRLRAGVRSLPLHCSLTDRAWRLVSQLASRSTQRRSTCRKTRASFPDRTIAFFSQAIASLVGLGVRRNYFGRIDPVHFEGPYCIYLDDGRGLAQCV